MYLKRIELQGFKSFSEKIRLEFNKGITAVVGPNGSGKSNISDAVRWVLGEQSVKSLRGVKMEDVIFAGTENRRPLGFAEVSIIIDNTDQRLPVAFEEIKVSRKVFRSGESEFQINGVPCRLKDIHEMFMDTGVGREGYSIIGQGRIEEILSARSEDRRYLFEEAAGIVKYKNRKQDTEIKLERQRQNLLRVNDIIAVLAEQLGPLQEQSEKTKLYLEIKERLKTLQVNLFLIESQKTENQLAAIGGNLDNLREQIVTEQSRLQSIKQREGMLKEKSRDIDANVRETGARLTELRSKTEQKENDVKFTLEQINTILSDVERLENEINRKTARIEGLEDAIKQAEARYNTLALDVAAKKDALKAHLSEFDLLNEKMSDSEQQINRFNTDILECAKRGAQAKADAERMRHSYEQLELRKEQINEEKLSLGGKLREKSEHLRGLQKTLEDLNALLVTVNNEQTLLESEKAETVASIQTEAHLHAEASKKLNDATSRLKILSDLEQSYEGYYKSVKAVLLQKKSDPHTYAGIHGAVGELVYTDAVYDTAIDIALGSALQNIVTQTEDDARAAIEYLKRSNMGRATFLPLSAVKAKPGMIRRDALKEKGVLGAAKDLVHYDSQYEHIFSNLLGSVVVMDSLDNAVRLYKKYRYAYKIVTLEGDLLSAGGAMTGGSLNQKTSGIFGRSREIKTLPEQIAAYSRESALHEGRLQKLNEQLRIIKSKLSENNGLLHEKALERVTLSENITQTQSQLSARTAQKQALESEDSRLIEQIFKMNRDIRDAEKRQLDIESEVLVLQQSLADFQTAMMSDREAKDGRIRQLTDLKVDISAIEQNMAAIQDEIKRLEAELAESHVKSENMRQDVLQKRARHEAKQRDIASFESDIAALQALQMQTAVALTQLDDAKEDCLETAAAITQEISDCQTLIFNLQSEQTRLEMKQEQVNADRRKIFDEMWDEYNLTAQSALAYKIERPSFDQMKREERSLKARLQEIGDVNVLAVEEYKQMRARYDEMTAQRDDILEAEKKLNALIGELTTLMEAQFREQFALISENFSKVFREMFAGGKAYLQLTDKNNVLESAIDIVAQPPGKTLQSMSLLSGGERALTATALLFGILLIKPSPFCILDEVEAALDDANVVRYANFLKNFARDTQFILITHRKGTMEAADVLYGVTMQEQGVSKLVSVSFIDGEAV